MFELIDICNVSKSVDDELKKISSDLCQYLNFDAWKIIMFTKDKNHGFIRYDSENMVDEVSNSLEEICFDKTDERSYLNLVLQKEKIVIHKNKGNKTSKYHSLLQDSLIELYFPLFYTIGSRKEIAGCLYLSKKNDLINDIHELLLDTYVVELLKNFQINFEIIYMEYIENRSFFNLVHIASEVIRNREPYMKSHPYNVAYLCDLMGQSLNFSEDESYRLYIAAILHDIGKFYIPEPILNKPGSLTESERNEMKRHPIHSYNIVKDLVFGIKNLSGIEDIILQHHERYDGTGYPSGIKGKDILFESRILAIADSVDAMLSERSYKKPKSIKKVIDELLLNKGKQFDPELAQVMINILLNKQKNQEIILNKPIVLGTLVLSTEKSSCQLQGTLIRTSFGFRFKPDSNECLFRKCTIRISDLISATFYTENNNKIYEYDAKIKSKTKSTLYIAELVPKPSSDYFSLLWELSGALSLKNSVSSEIIINKIGGDFLSFYADKNQFDNMDILNDVNNLKIFFEDNVSITVTGKVTSIIKVGRKVHCQFKYINILESTRDQIFKQIFKKQAEFRKSLVYAMIE